VIWGAVIVAAGRGTRFGKPKQLVELAGKPMLAWSIELFAAMPEVVDLVIVTEAEYVQAVSAVAGAVAGALQIHVAIGGAQRAESVQRGLAMLPERCAGVLVHDGARPLVEALEIRRAMRMVRPGIASLLAVPAVDTMKIATDEGRVERTLDRRSLWAAQTPQCATVRDLRRAYAEAGDLTSATDDASVLERAGIDVFVVESSPENFKVTYANDLERADAILRARAPMGEMEHEIFLVETFVEERFVDALLNEYERRGATIDGVERDLPNAVAVRAYLASERLRGFGETLHAIAGPGALYTTHLSHVAQRDADTSAGEAIPQ
jgi:2-C-methyl-D-erythritol 4-phosphate cytidylyltransferase